MAKEIDLVDVLDSLSSWYLGKSLGRLLALHSVVPKIIDRAKETRRALLEAAVVLLVAKLEGRIETIFETAFQERYPTLSAQDLREVFNGTSRQFRLSSPGSIDKLFLALGHPRITSEISWRNYASSKVKRDLSELLTARHEVAHGSSQKTDAISISRHAFDRWERTAEGFVRGLKDAITPSRVSV
jgi:hypothetical protein